MDIFSMFFGGIKQVWFFIPLLVLVFALKSRWFKGLLGEFIVNRLLSTLPKNTYTIIKNVTLPTEDGTTQIDHIVVSKFGIFVVETKNIKGWIFGSAKQKQWTQKIYRHSNKFQNPLHQNYKHIKTLESALSWPSSLFHSIIVFVGDSSFKTDMPINVTYASGCLKLIRSFGEEVLSESEVKDFIEIVEAIKLRPSLITDFMHRKHVNSIIFQKLVKQVCPSCGSDMLVREAKRGANAGQKFWGCSGFPKCREVLEIN